MATNATWQQRKEQAIARGMGNVLPVYIERAENAELWDVEGNRYIDFGSGIAVVNTGHGHPKIKQAAQEQIESFSHTCVMVTPYDSAIRLAEKLNEIAPGDSPKKSIFVTTGAEAVENCIKIARAYTGRPGVIAFNGGFHGRTNFTMGLTGKVAPYKAGFGPFPGDIYHAPFPIEYHGISVNEALASLENIFKVDIEPSQVAAMIIEPVQGEGGFYPAPVEFLQALRQLCDKHGIVLIADEIQTGFGRTGRMFYMEDSGIEPDLITSAKSLAGGFPIAAVTGKADIMDAPNPGGLGGTYAGSPIGCAAALAVMDVLETENLLPRAGQIGELMMARLAEMQLAHPGRVGHIRNTGAMVAMELVKDGDANKPAPDLAKAMVVEAAKNGLVLLSCGVRGNVIRFLVPLTASDALISEGMDIVSDVLNRLA